MPVNHEFKQGQSVLLAEGTVIADDYAWVIDAWVIDNLDEKPAFNHVIVSVENIALLAQATGKKGLFITVDDDLETLLAENILPIAELDVIAIHFKDFNDGRGYSYAALLRRAGYTGELRAVGDVFKDTLFYMKRCGFESFVLKPEKQADEAKSGIHTFSQSYQACQLSSSQYQTGQAT